MKKLVLLFALSLCVSPVLADNLFQNTNPFPQNNPERMNNIYESDPGTIQQEVKQSKKSWFKKGKNLQEQEITDTEKRLYQYPPQAGTNEGAQDGSFYLFNN